LQHCCLNLLFQPVHTHMVTLRPNAVQQHDAAHAKLGTFFQRKLQAITVVEHSQRKRNIGRRRHNVMLLDTQYANVSFCNVHHRMGNLSAAIEQPYRLAGPQSQSRRMAQGRTRQLDPIVGRDRSVNS
jgi:hypothetical protein